MKIKRKEFKIETTKQLEFINITLQIEEFLIETGIKEGQITIFCPHTTAALAINHDESMLIQDLSQSLYKVAPIDERYAHDMFELSKKNATSDGRSNGHSHCKQLFLNSNETVLVGEGKLLLNDRQDIFFVELDGSRSRNFFIQIMGE